MPKEDWEKNSVHNVLRRADLWPWKDGDIVTILDVACGLSFKSKFIPAQIRVGVDIYDEYFKHIESDVPFTLIKYDIRKMRDIFPPKSFDLVIALDIIEHLEKNESLDLIRQCEEIAKKGVVLETPRGFLPQNIDIWGYGGHEFQTHRCGYEPEELHAMGYKTVVNDKILSNVKRHTDIDVDPKAEQHVQQMDAVKVLSL